MKFKSVYITTRNRKEAEKIAALLLKKKLIACVNLFPVSSLYRWRGKIQRNAEYALICKTRQQSIRQLITEVKKAHSYEVPCIVSWDISEGAEDFLSWIRSETE